MSSTGAVLPSEATGSRHDEGSPDQLQLFHLKQSIASKTLIHYQKCMDKIVKYKREKKKKDILTGIICVLLDSPILCA